MAETIQSHSDALQMLDSPQLAGRKDAIRYVQQYQVREAIPLMLNMLLNDPEALIRIAITRTLSDLGVREAIPYLIDLLQLDPDINVRIVTLATLGKLKARQAISLILDLFHQLDTPENLLQMALWALKELNDRPTYTQIAQLLHKPDLYPGIQTLAIQILGETLSIHELLTVWSRTEPTVAQQIEETLRQQQIKNGLEEKLLSPHETEIQAGLYAFERLHYLDVLPTWLKGYASWPAILRQSALQGLSKLDVTSALNQQFPNLGLDEQKTALEIVQHLHLKKCLPMLFLQLPMVSRSMVQQIHTVLQEIGLAQFLAYHFKKNMSPEPLFIKALGVLRLQEAMPYLLKIYAHATEGLQKIILLQALKHLKAIPFLLQVACSDQHPYRWQALDILENLKAMSIASQLVPLAIDPNPLLAGKVLHMLQRFKAREQIPALLEISHRISPDLAPALWELFRSLYPGPIFLSLLKGTHEPQFVLNLLQAVEALELKETSPELAKIALRSHIPIQLRCLAILTRFKARQVVIDLLPLVGTKQSRLRNAFKELLLQVAAEPLLIHWVNTAPLKQQVASIYCIRLLQLKAAIPALLQLLKQAPPQLCPLLRTVLLELQPQKILIRYLAEDAPEEQSICLHALSELGLIDLVPTLLPHYSHLAEPQRQEFIAAIEQLEARPVIAATLDNPEFEVQVNALAVLHALKADEYVPLLMDFMVKHDGSAREVAMKVFRGIKGFHRIEQLLIERANDAEFYQLVAALGQTWNTPILISPLIQVLIQSPPEIQEKALSALRKQDAVPEVIKILNTLSPESQLRGISALGHLGAFATIPIVIGHLGHADPNIQIEAVRILRKLNAHQSIPQLMNLLVQTSDENLREAIVTTLQTFQVLQSLVPQMLQAHDADERHLALRVMVALDKIRAKSVVIEALRDPKAEMRILALHLLRHYDTQDVSALWIKSIKDIQPMVKETALRLLTEADPQKGLQYILDELFMATKPLLPSYQKGLLELLLGLPVALTTPRLLPLLENKDHAERFEKNLQSFLLGVLPQKPEALHFCFYYLIHAPQTPVGQVIWNTLPQVRSLVRIFLYNRATLVFRETPGFQALLQLMLRFSRLTAKEMRYFYQLCDRPFNVKFYLYLISVLYKRLVRLLEQNPPGILSEADLENLHFVFMEALNMAEEKYPRTLSQYRRYLIAVQSWRHTGKSNIIPLHGNGLREGRPPQR